MLHPPMHGLPRVPVSVGAPTRPLEPLRDTAYFKYIYENHQVRVRVWPNPNPNPNPNPTPSPTPTPTPNPNPTPHQGHHVLGGQCNYNVCCPLTDHLLGTYVAPEVWSKRMRAVPGPDATERW